MSASDDLSYRSETVEIEPAEDATGSVIWLHGLGADGHDFEPIVPELRLPASLPLRFVFPHAPVRPVTVNGGIPMRAWFDIFSFDRSGTPDEAGIRASAAALSALIEREHERGIPYERIVVAGFSQGGSIAMHTALRCAHRLAGLMALSTWMPLSATIADEVTANPQSQPRDLPVLLVHGSFDPILPVALGSESRAILQSLGFTVEWHEYPMAHAVCATEIDDIRNWLLGAYGAD